MKFFLLLLLVYGSAVMASSKEDIAKEALKKAIKKENKIAQEQKFYTADEYDFKGAEVNPKSLDKIKALEPDYDFDMDEGVYDD